MAVYNVQGEVSQNLGKGGHDSDQCSDADWAAVDVTRLARALEKRNLSICRIEKLLSTPD